MSRQADDLKQLIFKCDPYEGFETFPREFDDHGWFDNELSFSYIFDLVRPQTYLEVGVWKGKSLRWCAQHMKDIGIEDPVAIAVDTWQGSIEHWGGSIKSKTRLGALDLVNGYPQFYYQFMANTVHANLQDVVVPFPTTSLTAMRYLMQHGIKADVIFIDASHQYPEVYDDLTMAAGLLRDKNSILIGDDLSPWFPDVARSLKQFMAENPGWRMIKDGYGFVLLQPSCDLDFHLPKKPSKKQRKAEAERLAAKEAEDNGGAQSY